MFYVIKRELKEHPAKIFGWISFGCMVWSYIWTSGIPICNRKLALRPAIWCLHGPPLTGQRAMNTSKIGSMTATAAMPKCGDMGLSKKVMMAVLLFHADASSALFSSSGPLAVPSPKRK